MFLLSVIEEGEWIKLAIVKKDKNDFKIILTKTYNTEMELNDFQKEIGELRRKYQELYLSTAISTDQVLLRKLTLPFNDKKSIFKTLPFQLEPHLPFPIEQGIIYPYIERHKTSCDVLAFCIQNSSYTKHLEEMDKFRIDPHFVSCIPQALYRTTNFLFKEVNTITIYMGQDKTEIVSVFENKPIYAISIPYGKSQFLSALKLDRPTYLENEIETLLYQLDLADIKPNKDKNLSAFVKQFEMQLDRAFYFVMHKEGQRVHENLFYAGEKEIISQFHSSLEKSQDFTFHRLEAKEDDAEIVSYTTSFGICLDALSADSMSVQFRTVKNAQKELNKNLSKKYLFFSLSMLLFSAAVGGFFSAALKRKEKTLDARLSYFIEKNLLEDQTFREEELHDLGFIGKLKKVRKHFTKIKKPYGYYLLPTTVSELIDIISDTKAAVKEEKIKIFSLSYDLEEFPNLDEPFKEYKTKVELQIQAANKEDAEVFYKELLIRCGAVNEPVEIKQDNGIYGAVFFLKPSC